MARTRRRSYPVGTHLDDPKYGRRGNAKGKSHSGSRGQSASKQQLPNKPRRG